MTQCGHTETVGESDIDLPKVCQFRKTSALDGTSILTKIFLKDGDWVQSPPKLT